MSKLDDAFAEAEQVHHWLTVEDVHEYNFLTLECLGTSDNTDRWAATFDTITDDYEWYESWRIANYPTSARAATPAEAIRQAVLNLAGLTGAPWGRSGGA